jgi:hypothetical protein
MEFANMRFAKYLMMNPGFDDWRRVIAQMKMFTPYRERVIRDGI